MWRKDWFDKLTIAHMTSMEWAGPGARRHFFAALEGLESVLDGKVGPAGFGSIHGLSGFSHPAALNAAERQRIERLGERLWKASGTGRTQAEEWLLLQVAAQASPDSLAFFRAAAEANRQRDSFQASRRRIAVASVAFIAHQTGDTAAHAQLEAWLTHSDVTVRTEAVDLYGRLHVQETGRLAQAPRAVLERVAYTERTFPPRFLARRWLHVAGVPVRVEPPDGVYAFKASLGRASRTVELTASQSLAQLASAILSAFKWDHDHLYEFALTADLKDRRFILPDADDEVFEPDWGFDEDEEQEEPDDREPSEAPSPMSLPLGALGFTQGHKLIFHFDFGDDHRFQVTVAGIHEQRSPRAKYPRVVAEMGKAPEQYPRLDGE
ncbi:MAG TPA: hypothetical protein VF815_27165 [Myxococcaceae bacterium]|jgi:hypothetical protein